MRNPFTEKDRFSIMTPSRVLPCTELTPRRRDISRLSPRAIALIAGAAFYLGALIIFRDVLFAIPAILRGDAVITGDELVPFFNWRSQLLEQAAGQFNELVNGYEFRVRYAFLTTWLRHYAVLPFAIVIIIPSLFWAVYLCVARFVDRVFAALSTQTIYLATFFPVALLYLIMVYAKITHFYTLILGLALMTMSSLWMLYGLLFSGKKWKRWITLASAVTLLNPAVHYLILFSLFFALTLVTLLVGEIGNWVRTAGPGRFLGRLVGLRNVPGERRHPLAWTKNVCETVAGKAVIAVAIFLVITIIPYALFVKYVALAGVPNLTDTVPGDFYFIQDASVSWMHELSWDLAGISDKILFGDYLAKTPRFLNVFYSVVILLPVAVPRMRRQLFRLRPQRQLLGISYVAVFFALWATIGYGEPLWFPTFHRTLAALAAAANDSHSVVGDLIVTAAATVVQVLRFPHRFQLILFMLGPLLMTTTLAYAIDVVSDRLTTHRPLFLPPRRRAEPQRSLAKPWPPVSGAGGHRAQGELMVKLLTTICIGAIFFTPFWANEPYRRVLGSGNMAGLLAPFPIGDLKGLKAALNTLPEGKAVVIPPTETAKLVADSNDIDHKFIDKFFIYYLDKPSYYYGLTGDVGNKFDFFLILRGLYYQQDWWINIARDIRIRYIVVNRKIHANSGFGAEYLPNVESYVEPALLRLRDRVALRYENESYALYEIRDQVSQNRAPILIGSSWQSYLDLIFNRPDLSRCYTFSFTPYVDPSTIADTESVRLLTDQPNTSALDLYLLKNPRLVNGPDSRMFAFNPDVIASNYYLSPMFRSFLLFSNTKWNRMNMITPGIFGTLRGTFIGLPRETEISVPVKVPENGKYRLLMRSANTANSLKISSRTLNYEKTFEVRSSANNVKFFHVSDVFSEHRQPVETGAMSVLDMETAVGNELVPVNNGYSYQDLGSVEAIAGTHTFTISKTDTNPMLFEGLMLVPEDDYESIRLPSNVIPITDPSRLECSREDSPAGAGGGSIGPRADLTHNELLDLAAADVQDLAPPAGGVVGPSWVGLLFTLGLLAFSGILVGWRAYRHPDD